MEYTAPYVIIEGACLVRNDAPLQRNAWLGGFIEEMKASGFVAESLTRHGIEGAGVAPCASPCQDGPRPP